MGKKTFNHKCLVVRNTASSFLDTVVPEPVRRWSSLGEHWSPRGDLFVATSGDIFGITVGDLLLALNG